MPTAGDVVVIDRPAGNFVVTVSSTTATLASLHATEQLDVPEFSRLPARGSFAGGLNLTGTLSGSGGAVLGGPMTWTSGIIALAGGLTVGPGRTLTVATGNQHVLTGGGTLRNHGTVLWTGGHDLHSGQQRGRQRQHRRCGRRKGI